jgi:hypothetical protein
MVVKDNHKTLRRKLECFFASGSLFEAEFVLAQQRQTCRGRVETRRVLASANVPEQYTGFCGVRQVFVMDSTNAAHFRAGAALQKEWLASA